jgi:hypothetical protein
MGKKMLIQSLFQSELSLVIKDKSIKFVLHVLKMKLNIVKSYKGSPTLSNTIIIVKEYQSYDSNKL